MGLYYTPTGEQVKLFNMTDEVFFAIKLADAAGDLPLQLVDVDFPGGGKLRTFACYVVVLEGEPTVPELAQARMLSLKQQLNAVGREIRQQMLDPYEQRCKSLIWRAEADLAKLPKMTKAEIVPQFDGLNVKYTTNFAWEG